MFVNTIYNVCVFYVRRLNIVEHGPKNNMTIANVWWGGRYLQPYNKYETLDNPYLYTLGNCIWSAGRSLVLTFIEVCRTCTVEM